MEAAAKPVPTDSTRNRWRAAPAPHLQRTPVGQSHSRGRALAAKVAELLELL